MNGTVWKNTPDDEKKKKRKTQKAKYGKQIQNVVGKRGRTRLPEGGALLYGRALDDGFLVGRDVVVVYVNDQDGVTPVHNVTVPPCSTLLKHHLISLQNIHNRYGLGNGRHAHSVGTVLV